MALFLSTEAPKLMSNFIENGYLHTEIDTDSPVAETIIFCVLSISLVTQVAIFVTAVIQIKKHPDIALPACMCLLFSFFCSSLCTVSDLVRQVWDPHDYELNVVHEQVLVFIMWTSLALFYGTTLLTYIVRLYITFKDSEFKMSTSLRIMFIVLTVLYALCSIAFFTLYTFGRLRDTVFDSILLSLLLLFCSIYTIGCVLAVYFFVSNLSNLVKATVTTPQNAMTPRCIALDRQQLQISDLSSKYSMLFGMGLVSTVILVVIALSFSSTLAIREVLLSVDMCVNLWCNYLQFSFANECYKGCCGRCDSRCREYGLRRTRVMVYDYSNSTELSEIRKSASATVSSGSIDMTDDEMVDTETETHEEHGEDEPLNSS